MRLLIKHMSFFLIETTVKLQNGLAKMMPGRNVPKALSIRPGRFSKSKKAWAEALILGLNQSVNR